MMGFVEFETPVPNIFWWKITLNPSQLILSFHFRDRPCRVVLRFYIPSKNNYKVDSYHDMAIFVNNPVISWLFAHYAANMNELGRSMQNLKKNNKILLHIALVLIDNCKQFLLKVDTFCLWMLEFIRPFQVMQSTF